MAAIANAKAPFRFFLARRLGEVPVSQPHLPSLRQLGDQSQGLADLRDRSDGCDPISTPFTSAQSVEGVAGIDARGVGRRSVPKRLPVKESGPEHSTGQSTKNNCSTVPKRDERQGVVGAM